MRDVIIEELSRQAKFNKDVVLLTGDLGFGVLQAFEENFPKQFFNVGIAEQNMTGLAAGLALEGKIVITYSIGNFNTLRCLEQIRNEICYHKLHVIVLTVGAGFSYGPLGFSHHATEDIGILRVLPNLSVVAPGCFWEAKEAIKAMINNPGPYYLRVDKSSAGNTRSENEEFKIGKGRILRSGNDCTFIVSGGILEVALKAADKLADLGVKCSVMSMHTIKPIDCEMIESLAKCSDGFITIEEHNIVGGLGSAVSEYLVEAGIRPRFFKRIGLKDVFSSIVGTQDFLRKYYEIDVDYISSTALSLVQGIRGTK